MKKVKKLYACLIIVVILTSSVCTVWAADCAHNLVKDYYIKTTYQKITGDNVNHTMVHVFERQCDSCGKVIAPEVKGNSEKEKHTFSGNTCTKCKYVKTNECVHNDCKDYYTKTVCEPIKGDNKNHNAIHYYTKKCVDCGVVKGTDIKGETQKEEHSYLGDKCSSCGYTKQSEECKHNRTEKNLADTEYSVINGNDTYHNEIGVYTQNCVDCGKILKTNVKENKKKSAHDFNGLECEKCGYIKESAQEKPKKDGNKLFVDVNADDSYYKALEYLYNKKIISGKEDNKFDPEGNLTRAEAVTIICKMLSNKKHSNINSGFNDVPKSHWASGYIKEAKDLNIISGKGNNEFAPSETLTGFEFVKMLVCYLGYGDEVVMEYADSAWPNGYYYYGRDKLNLLKNAPKENYNLPIKRSDAVVLAYNAHCGAPDKTNASVTRTSKEGYQKATAFNGKRTLGDEDGLSCALYAPAGSRGIQTHVNIKDVELQLHNGANSDVDNAYIYLCINSSEVNGDFGLLWHGDENKIYVVCSSTNSTIGWKQEEKSELMGCEDIQLEIVWKSSGYETGGEGLYFTVYANGEFVYEQKIPFSGNFSNSSFGRVASMTNSIVNNWGINQSDSDEEKAEKQKYLDKLNLYKNGYYLYMISSNETAKIPEELGFVKNLRTTDPRASAEFKNIKFFDTYYHDQYGGVHKLTIDAGNEQNKGELWIYPNKDKNYKLNDKAIYTKEKGQPIVTCTEYVENGKIVNEVNFENY